MENNFFKYIEVIEAGSAKLLAFKLRSITIPFQIVNIVADGGKHYAYINAKRKLPKRLLDSLNTDIE